MTGINHALSGALIGAVLPLPVAIPLAFTSHFVIDTFPHYGIEERAKKKSLIWRWVMYSDTILAICIALAAIYYRRWDMEIAGWVAFSPDLIWIYYYFKQKRNFALRTRSAFTRFHRRIQNESREGMLFEVVLALLLVQIFIIELHK